MRGQDTIEFYIEGGVRIATVPSSMPPLVGQQINIRRVTYTVTGVTFAVDFADDFEAKHMRANVDLCVQDGAR